MVEVKKKGRRPRNTQAFNFISDIQSGGVFILKKRYWLLKTPPGSHIIRRYIKREFKVETLADDSGWRITAL